MVTALDDMTERGLISRNKECWQLDGALKGIDLEVPKSLQQMIEAQIDRLSTEEKRVLEVASLESVGRSRFAVVSRAPVVGLEPEVFENVCETLSRRHCIVRSAGSEEFPDGTVSACYEFVHVLYRQVCYRRVSPGRRAPLHKRFGGGGGAQLGTIEQAALLAGALL